VLLNRTISRKSEEVLLGPLLSTEETIQPHVDVGHLLHKAGQPGRLGTCIYTAFHLASLGNYN